MPIDNYEARINTLDELADEADSWPNGTLLLVEQNGVFVPLMLRVCRAKPVDGGYEPSDDPQYGFGMFFIPISSAL